MDAIHFSEAAGPQLATAPKLKYCALSLKDV